MESKNLPIQSRTRNHVTTVLGCDVDLPTVSISVTHLPKCDQILLELDGMLMVDNAYLVIYFF
jgi:hypothetical protein